MSLESVLNDIIDDADEFYIIEEQQRLICHCLGDNCARIVCYDLSCGCQQTDHCDINEGETVKSVYPTAKEITREEFKEKFSECYRAEK